MTNLDVFFMLLIPALIAYFLFRSVKEPTKRMMYLAFVFLFATLSPMAVFNKFLLQFYWYDHYRFYIFIGTLLIFFNWLFIGAIVFDRKVNKEKLIFANNLYTENELRVKRYKRFFYYIFLLIAWVAGMYQFGAYHFLHFFH